MAMGGSRFTQLGTGGSLRLERRAAGSTGRETEKLQDKNGGAFLLWTYRHLRSTVALVAMYDQHLYHQHALYGAQSGVQGTT